jgi:tRNA nucleotidyltransferase (CCA-adding enzyme)
MPDYIYLLENRLSADQQHALRQLREAAREAEMILFLTGDAVRDLTSGHAVRDLEVAVHGNALKLKKIITKLGGKVWGENETSHSLYLCFPGTVRVDVISTHRTEYPQPGKAVYHQASIQEDLRRRDFTVNAMAISLNEGSFGLLMDPLNGAADIEARTLRLVSNYGFLEEPSLLIHATRYIARLGWELDPKTQTRYENAKAEGVIEHLSAEGRSQELEQIGHEEDGLKVLRALEAEGWMAVLFPAWTSAKADEEKLRALHDLAVELQLQGVHPDMSAAQIQLLTTKLAAKDLAALKKLMLRPGFVEEWNSLDSLAAGFQKALLAKGNSTPSTSFKLFTSYDPEAILWLGFTSKDAAVRERYEQFLKVWPEARQRIPHALMQEMRITPELATYKEIVAAVFLELIDGRLTTPEEFRAFLEPHSPPAPPPQVTIKRPRAKRGAEAKVKERSYDDDEADDSLDEDADLDDLGGDDDEIDLGLNLPKVDLDAEITEDSEPVEDDLDADEPEPAAVPAKRAANSPKEPKPGKENSASSRGPIEDEKRVSDKHAAVQGEKAAKPEPAAKTTPSPTAAPAGKGAAATPNVGKTVKSAKVAAAVSAVAVKATVKLPVKVPVKALVKMPVKAPAKVPAKLPTKAPAKPPVKTLAKPQARPSSKVPAKVQHKTAAKTPKKGSTGKHAPAKGKPASPANSKTAKASHPPKPSKPATKKPVPKPAHKAGRKR